MARNERSWWQRLLPRRWRRPTDPGDPVGVMSAYAAQQVRARLNSPEWGGGGGAPWNLPRSTALTGTPRPNHRGGRFGA